jgi:two-component system NtrC family sensor kinase
MFLPGFLENIFVNAPIGIIATDLKRVITSANRLAAQLHGVNDGNELMGKTFPNFICHSSSLLKKINQVLDGTIDKLNIEYHLPEGNERKTIRLVSTLLRDDQYMPIGLLNMCEDITNEKSLVEQVKNYNKNLKTMVKEKTKKLKIANLQLIQSEKLRVLGNLIASVAHEIGNPLQSLECHMSYIQEGLSDDDLQESADTCLREINRLGHLLDKLKRTNRSNNGRKAPASINQLVEDVLHLNRGYLLHKNIQLEKHLEPDLPPLWVFADQIRQVFMNLIINAADSMPDGGQFKVATRFDNKNILIEFSDTGLGIPQEDIEKIFAPFFTTKLMTNGLGLGLSVSSQIVGAHKGKILVESETEKGTSFFISLPVNNKKGGGKVVK